VVRRATSTIPVVIAASGDPVSFGFVQSLSRPGGNITGLSAVGTDLSNKYLELLRVAIPNLSTAIVLINPGHPGHGDYLKNIQAAAQATGVRLLPVQASTPSQIEAALGVAKRDRAGALVVPGDGLFFLAGSPDRGAGGPAASAHVVLDSRARGVRRIDELRTEPVGAVLPGRHLRGQDPQGREALDLPVEQPTTIELVINLKTARAIGLTVPPELRLRADRIVE
jgi:putative ABC transport system substrate-binding protein